MRAVIVAGFVAAGALVAACSFVTSFPDIEVVGGGGDGVGGGGNVACVEAACRNCLTPAASCPVPGEPIALVAPASVPGESPATMVEVVDIVQKTGGARTVGNFRDTGNAGLSAADGLLQAGDLRSGFIVGPTGERIAGLGACGAGTRDVVLSSATVADDRLVVSGVFVGEQLMVFPSALDCSASPNITAPPLAEDFVPFTITFTTGDLVFQALSPDDSGGDLENGYIADVAALPGGAEAGRVAAIGYATRDPFGKGTEYAGIPRYYALVATNNVVSAEVVLDKSACGDFSVLDAMRSSVAVDSGGRIWTAGTGCPLNQQGEDESFITRFDGADLDGATTLTLDDSPIGITEIAVSDAVVVVAGSYSGKPLPALESGDPIEAGQAGDAFVMAFTRDGWGNQSKPLWFRRIESDGGAAARVETLAVDGGRVFIGGRMGASGGIGNREGCWASLAPGRGRAFFAQLSEASGSLDWLNVEGFEAANAEGIAEMSARGMALSPVNGGLLTATGFHGELLLECGPDATNALQEPEVWLRLFDLQ